LKNLRHQWNEKNKRHSNVETHQFNAEDLSMTSALDIARIIFPDKPDDWLDYVLWNRTAYPMSKMSTWVGHLEEFRHALKRIPMGATFCELCNNTALPSEWLCEDCNKRRT
jgi:hypothetical protein